MKRAIAVLIALIIVFAAVPLFASGSLGKAPSAAGNGHHYQLGWSRGNNPHALTVSPPPPPSPIIGHGKGSGKKG